jgi:hypothetical protein
MSLLARRNLFHDKVRFAVTLTGIVFALVLIIIQFGRILGKKNVRTDEPSEHVDTKILETLVELDPGQPLPLGLRVDSFIEAGGAQRAE